MARTCRFSFKQLDVYEEALDHFRWTIAVVRRLPARYARISDQAVGASLSTIGNLGEASGRRLKPREASQHYRYAQGSTDESAAYLDALYSVAGLHYETYDRREEQLARIAARLTRMIELQNRRPTP